MPSSSGMSSLMLHTHTHTHTHSRTHTYLLLDHALEQRNELVDVGDLFVRDQNPWVQLLTHLCVCVCECVRETERLTRRKKDTDRERAMSKTLTKSFG